MKSFILILFLSFFILFLSTCKKKYIQVTPIVEIENISSPTTENIRSIEYINNEKIYISTNTGLFLSTDFGKNWSELIYFKNKKCNKVIFVNNDTGFVAGNNKVYTTYNSGQDWVEYDIDGNVTDIEFKNKTAFMSVTDENYSRIYKNPNLGTYWFEVFNTIQISSLNTISVVDETHIFASGTEEVYSFDGNSFDFIDGCSNCLDVVDSYFTKIDSVDSKYWEGYSLYRFNGKVKTYGNDDLFDDWKFKNKRIKFYNNSEKGVIVGEKTVLKRETDRNWTYLYNKDGSTISYDYNDFVFLDEDLIIAVGSNGIISKIQL